MSSLHSENDPARIIESDRAHVWHHLIQHKPFETVDPRIIVEGKGIRVWDIKGKEHLDAVSGGVWTVNVGYGRTEIADAVRDQLVRLNYFAGSAGSIPAANFSRRLIEKMPGMSRVYYCNSGSEANEKAWKMIRQIAHKRYGGKKHKILYRERDYHGTTITALSAGGQPERNALYGPFTPGFVEVPHCLEYRSQWGEVSDYGARAVKAIEEVILREGPDTIGGLCLEPVTAGGGVITPPEGYWEGVQELCRKYDILLHIDEVVCGVGRTGTWFGYQNYGIKPDLVTMAKGVASGYAAIACLVTTEAVFEMFKDDAADPLNYFRDISTFGGCTAGPAAALENMRIIEDEGLLDNTLKMGARLMDNLHALKDRHAVVGDVRGKGLFCGAELVSDRASKTAADERKVAAVVADCLAQGVIIGMTNRSLPGLNNTLCLSPALIATPDDIDEITTAIDAAAPARLFAAPGQAPARPPAGIFALRRSPGLFFFAEILPARSASEPHRGEGKGFAPQARHRGPAPATPGLAAASGYGQN
jgi:taurine-pyruvate aminotransferase